MKYINLFNTETEYDNAEKQYPNSSYIVDIDQMRYVEKDYSKEYLTFEALEDGTFTFIQETLYSVDGGMSWTRYYNTPVSVLKGDRIQVKNNQNYNNKNIVIATGRYNVYGNIMSLMYGDDFVGQTTFPNSYNFQDARFSNNLVSAENLILPATTLTERCYNSMFQGCTSLTTAPELPATTLANYCYQSMFTGCTSLTTAPELPATTLKYGCYQYMFYGCANLNYIKAMFTTTPSNSYTNFWVNGVASTGTFVKNSAATWNVTGYHGIPDGWTVETQQQ